ncbi:hypothetical protein Ent638_0787 [Enterobacter sp. 638]|uniref:Uncharacterized protein n=1 Tax=Enterobacter sp. (strain 638) TaxID=399742 RepID=A0A9J9KWV7_ENT38|nr:hypothetical protein Ent638_0787 [Enterobacter sp. 638]
MRDRYDKKLAHGNVRRLCFSWCCCAMVFSVARMSGCQLFRLTTQLWQYSIEEARLPNQAMNETLELYPLKIDINHISYLPKA